MIAAHVFERKVNMLVIGDVEDAARDMEGLIEAFMQAMYKRGLSEDQIQWLMELIFTEGVNAWKPSDDLHITEGKPLQSNDLDKFLKQIIKEGGKE